MQPLLQDYLERRNNLHQEILESIDGLLPEELDWTPLKETHSDMNSINVLVTHLCGAERYWIGDVILGDPSERVRASEFEVRELNSENLAEKIFAATVYARTSLEKIEIGSLGIEKTKLRDGHAVTAGWARLHALEHTAIQLGHSQIRRQRWDEQQKELDR